MRSGSNLETADPVKEVGRVGWEYFNIIAEAVQSIRTTNKYREIEG
jgi:hypothetical protein